MGTETKYRKCPKCELNYITGDQRVCAVCESGVKPYRGRYCQECGGKSGLYNLCRSCYKVKDMSANERRAAGGYRTDRGMVGSRTNRVCKICGTPTYGRLCGRCYMATLDNDDKKENK